MHCLHEDFFICWCFEPDLTFHHYLPGNDHYFLFLIIFSLFPHVLTEFMAVGIPYLNWKYWNNNKQNVF